MEQAATYRPTVMEHACLAYCHAMHVLRPLVKLVIAICVLKLCLGISPVDLLFNSSIWGQAITYGGLFNVWAKFMIVLTALEMLMVVLDGVMLLNAQKSMTARDFSRLARKFKYVVGFNRNYEVYKLVRNVVERKRF